MRSAAVFATVVALTVVWSLAAGAAGAALPRGADGARHAPVGERQHIREVQAYVSALPAPVTPPLVFYIGDSTARESVVSEAGLAGAVATQGGPIVQPYVLAGSNQTFPTDLAIAKGLPDEPALVLIAVGLSRFSNRPAVTPLGEPLTGVTALSAWKQHLYKASKVMTLAQKRAKVRWWLTKRHPSFKANEPRQIARLKKLTDWCLARGWTVVYVDMPLNRRVVRHAFDTPLAKYRRDVRAVARARGLTYLRFSGSTGLTNADFYDVIHLVGAGRVKWQRRLGAEIRKLMTSTPATSAASPTSVGLSYGLTSDGTALP